MNHYAQALAELQAASSHELKQIGDQWQTPKPLAWGLFHHFAPTLGPVVLDMFADDCNALLPHYYDAEDNALTQELAADLRRLGGAAFANPPYSRPCVDGEGNPLTGMDAILTFCREQRAQGAKIMLLIKAATSETWWPDDADFIQFIAGRIGFNVPDWYNPRDPKKDKPSSSGFASAVVIFDASWQGERRPVARLRRDDLITTGTIILDMINRQALELTLAAKQVMTGEPSNKTEQLPEHHTQVCELRIYQTDAGQWAAKYLEDGEEVAGIGGCGSVDEALAAANDCGWPWNKLTAVDPLAWEPPVASDDTTNAAAALELAELEVATLIDEGTKLAELGYADADSIMVKQLDQKLAWDRISKADQAKARDLVQGWLDEKYPLAEIFYRLHLAFENLLNERPVHHGFIQDGRVPTLDYWGRHPAVRDIIYQIEDAAILTPRKTAELAGWIIDNLTADGDLLALATAKAAELLAQSAEQPRVELDHPEQPLEMVEALAEPVTGRTVQELIFEFDNNELPVSDWCAFIAVLAGLYPRTVGEISAEHDRFTNAQIRFALCQCNDEDGVTEVPEQTTFAIECVHGALHRIDDKLALSKAEMYLVAAHQAKLITDCLSNSSANLVPSELEHDSAIDLITNLREQQQEVAA